MKLEYFLEDQRLFSERAFGPGPRTRGIIRHIHKELCEIEDNPLNLLEWVDVIILALDGAWRAGHSPENVCDAMVAKLERNKRRTWPDWRQFTQDEAIEHDRRADDL